MLIMWEMLKVSEYILVWLYVYILRYDALKCYVPHWVLEQSWCVFKLLEC